MTLREFSEAIGVARGTVSKALGAPEKYRISAERRAYIRAKAEELGFMKFDTPHATSKAAKRIGIVCGPMLSNLGEHLLAGAQDTATSAGIELFHRQCDNSVKAETDALRQMLFEKMDAILYWPGMLSRVGFRRRLEKLQKEAGSQIPVIYFHEDPTSNALLLHYNEEDTARIAARRQLALGCRKFAILRYYKYWGIDERASRAYRDELIKNGIESRRIRMFIHAPDTSKPEDFAGIKEVHGIWAEQSLVLLTMAPTLARYTDLKKLHVDCMDYIEALDAVNMICNPFARHEGKTLDLKWLYGSAVIKFCSLRRLGARAVDFAARHIDNTDPELPRRMDMEWLTPEEIQAWGK